VTGRVVDGGRRFELAPGYDVSRLIVGGWQLSAGHHAQPVAEDEAVERLVALADLGLDTLDCADIYTGVEELYGRFLKRWRTTSGSARPIRVHTKLVPDLSLLPRVDAAYVAGIVDRSLRRLGVDALDLVQFYWWDFQVGDWLGAARALGELVRAGKVRHLGATNLTGPEVRALEDAAGVPVVADQVQYSALDLRPEHGLAEHCARSATRMLCYGGLAGGLLTSRWLGAPAASGPFASRSLTKYRLIVDEFGGWAAYQALLAELAAIGAAKGVEASAIALRFVLDQAGVAAAITGFSTVARMRDNLRALDVTLDAHDHARIRHRTDAAPGPRGDVFALERDRSGPHGRIMKYDLNEARGP
jgi:aryl-alcohol dehydrogenase-like predicted oxidoreductase